MNNEHPTIGHHYIVEASGCNPEIISNVTKVQKILLQAAEISGVTVFSSSFNVFPPNGVSGVVVIAESHISIHTWPEKGYVALDIYTCGGTGDPEEATIWAVEQFGATHYHISELTRGLDEDDKFFYHSIITWEEDIKEDKINRYNTKRKKKR